MSKEDLLNNLAHIRMNLYFGFLLLGNLLELDQNKWKKEFYITPVNFELSELVDLLKNDENRKSAIDGFWKMQLRIFHKEIFEVVKAYCKKNKQLNKFKSQDWYDFARIIRNALSHDYIIRFNESDIKKLPIRWREKVLRKSIDGKKIPIWMIEFLGTFELFYEIKNFVKVCLE